MYITSAYLPKAKLRPGDELEYLEASAKLHPNSTMIKNRIARTAMKARDFELAAKMFSQLGDRVELYVWRPNEFYKERSRLEKMGYEVKKDAFPPLPALPAEVSRLDLDPETLLYHISELFTGERYAELDAVCDALRQNGSRFPDGRLKMEMVSSVFPDLKLTDLESWECSVLFGRWRKQNPRSSTAAAGAVRNCVNEAWDIRGGGYANQVSERQWKGFKERQEVARSYLAEAETAGADKDPDLYAAAITMGMGLGLKRAHIEAYLARARALNPDDPRAFRAMAEYLLPRWHSSDAELAAFLDGLNPEMFLAVSNAFEKDDLPMSVSQLQARSTEGAAAIARKRPSLQTWTDLLFNAYTSRDRGKALEALSHMNGKWAGGWLPDRKTYTTIVRWARGS